MTDAAPRTLAPTSGSSTSAIRAGHTVRVALLRRRLSVELRRDRARSISIVALGVGFAAVVFGVGYGGAWYATVQRAPELVLTGTVAGLTGISLALVFSSLGHAAQAFFSAKDLWLWECAPTGPFQRFVDRFTETCVAALPPTLALGTLALVGLQAGSGGGAGGAVRACLAVFMVAPVPVALGVTLAHLGGAVLPAGRLRRLSLVLLGVALTAGLVWFRQLRVERLLTERGAAELLSTAGQLSTFGPPYLPAQRLARFVVDADVGAFFAGALGVLVAVAIAFFAHVALYERARRLAVDESPTGVLKGSLGARMLDIATAAAPADLRPLLRKDLLAFVRDPGQWGQVILLAGVGVLYAVNASAMGDGLVILGSVGRAVLVAMHTGIVAFIAGGLAARFAFPQVGLEGPAVWITDGAPLHPRRLLLAKWLAALPVAAAFPSVLAVVGAVVLDLGARTAATTSVVLALFSTLCAGLGVARGARQPLYDAASLSELAMGPGALSTIVQATVFAGALAVGALVTEGLSIGAARGVVAATLGVGGVAAIALPLVFMWGSARKALRVAEASLLARRTDGGPALPSGAPPQESVDTLE